MIFKICIGMHTVRVREYAEYLHEFKTNKIEYNTYTYLQPEFRILIRKFLGLADPDPLVRGTDPHPKDKILNGNPVLWIRILNSVV